LETADNTEKISNSSNKKDAVCDADAMRKKSINSTLQDFFAIEMKNESNSRKGSNASNQSKEGVDENGSNKKKGSMDSYKSNAAVKEDRLILLDNDENQKKALYN